MLYFIHQKYSPRKSNASILMIFFLIAGCSQPQEPTPPPIEGALFCDLVTERFRFLQEEIDVRAANWPANLRREFQINGHYDAECVEDVDV